jgi:hypothetical protein
VDNRRDKRFEERDDVLLEDKSQTAQAAAREAVKAYTHDVSVSGAWICCERDFPVGYVIRIAIDLGAGEPPVDLDGEVIWSRPNPDGRQFDIGVEFLHSIPATILTLLRHFYGKKDGLPSSVS